MLQMVTTVLLSGPDARAVRGGDNRASCSEWQPAWRQLKGQVGHCLAPSHGKVQQEVGETLLSPERLAQCGLFWGRLWWRLDADHQPVGLFHMHVPSISPNE